MADDISELLYTIVAMIAKLLYRMLSIVFRLFWSLLLIHIDTRQMYLENNFDLLYIRVPQYSKWQRSFDQLTQAIKHIYQSLIILLYTALLVVIGMYVYSALGVYKDPGQLLAISWELLKWTWEVPEYQIMLGLWAAVSAVFTGITIITRRIMFMMPVITSAFYLTSLALIWPFWLAPIVQIVLPFYLLYQGVGNANASSEGYSIQWLYHFFSGIVNSVQSIITNVLTIALQRVAMPFKALYEIGRAIKHILYDAPKELFIEADDTLVTEEAFLPTDQNDSAVNVTNEYQTSPGNSASLERFTQPRGEIENLGLGLN